MQLASRWPGIDSLSCCGGKRGAERGGPVAKQQRKKSSTFGEWQERDRSNETESTMRCSKNRRRLLQSKTVSFWLVCRR